MTLDKFTMFLGLYIFLWGKTLLSHLDVSLTVCTTLLERKNLQWSISMSCMPSPPCHIAHESYHLVLRSCQQKERGSSIQMYFIVPLLMEAITRSTLILYNGMSNGVIFGLM